MRQRQNRTILDEKTATLIQDYFAKVDAKNISAEKRTLEKAFLAQYISDTSDGNTDLYRISAQFLIGNSPQSEDDIKEKYMLLKKCHARILYTDGKYKECIAREDEV